MCARPPGRARAGRDAVRDGRGRPETTEDGFLAENIKKGDHVTWKSHGSETEGTVTREITSETEAAGRKVKASKDEPQYEVKSDKSGKTAVHKPGALHKK